MRVSMLLAIYLFLEVMVSTWFASQLGGLFTFVEIIFSAFLGFYFLKGLKSSLISDFKSMYGDSFNAADLFRVNFSVIIGAILLIIPGFLTDIIGIILQFELGATLLFSRFSKAPKQDNKAKTYTKEGEYDVIDVEIVDDSYTINR
jgi:UPF0716 family protein affecting phage T7 exclusion